MSEKNDGTRLKTESNNETMHSHAAMRNVSHHK